MGAKVIIHWFIHSAVPEFVRFSAGSQNGCLVRTPKIAISVFTPTQKIRTNRGNELELDPIDPNKTGVNTPSDLFAERRKKSKVYLKSFLSKLVVYCFCFFVLAVVGDATASDVA